MARGTRFRSRNPVKVATSGLYINDVQVTASAATLNAAVSGVAAGYKVARGSAVSVLGSLEIATGLTTVVAAVACFESATNVGTGTSYSIVVENAATAGSIKVSTYKEDGSTQGAASNDINWIAIGT